MCRLPSQGGPPPDKQLQRWEQRHQGAKAGTCSQMHVQRSTYGIARERKPEVSQVKTGHCSLENEDSCSRYLKKNNNLLLLTTDKRKSSFFNITLQLINL